MKGVLVCGAGGFFCGPRNRNPASVAAPIPPVIRARPNSQPALDARGRVLGGFQVPPRGSGHGHGSSSERAGSARVEGASARHKIVRWCFDLYPEAAIAGGVLRAESAVVRAIKRLLRAAHSRCDLLVDIGPCLRAKLSRHGPSMSPGRSHPGRSPSRSGPSRSIPVSDCDGY
jgi:hypothetical protein